MNLYVTKDYDELSELTTNLLLSYMLQPKRVNISITGGTSPKGVYEKLSVKVKDKKYFDNVKYYNFDEIPIVGEDMGVTIKDLNRLYFDKANIDKNNICILDEKNYNDYEKFIFKQGGLDAVLLGIGKDGHFCGNLPNYSTFSDVTRKVIINKGTPLYERIKFLVGGDESKVPDGYITMGTKTIMNVKNIILIVKGKEKADIIK